MSPLPLRSNPGKFDAVLLDVDNSSDALTTSTNGWLYSDRGIDAIRVSADGRTASLAMWLASDDRRFARRLRQHGFTVDVAHVRGRLKRGPRHAVLLAYQSVGR